MVKLFVSGFPLDMSELQLAQLFSPHGDLRTIKLVRDRKTRVCKGYGFIEMGDLESAENAVSALHGLEMGDRTLTVNIKPEEDAPPPRRPAPAYSKPARSNESFVKKKRPRL